MTRFLRHLLLALIACAVASCGALAVRAMAATATPTPLATLSLASYKDTRGAIKVQFPGGHTVVTARLTKAGHTGAVEWSSDGQNWTFLEFLTPARRSTKVLHSWDPGEPPHFVRVTAWPTGRDDLARSTVPLAVTNPRT